MSGTSDASREIVVGRWKLLTEVELPRKAKEERWPLRLDHCFKRVCLDWACQGCWYGHIKRPAERNADLATLQRAVGCAEEILASGVVLLQQRNMASLGWRGKLMAGLAGASECSSGDVKGQRR